MCLDFPGGQEVYRLARGIGVQRCPNLPGGQVSRLARWPGGV